VSNAGKLRALIAAAGMSLIAACPAGAATVNLTSSQTQINFTAAVGETNNLTISQSGATITFSDAVAITPVAPCAPVSATVATCPVTPTLIGIFANLSDLSDRAVADGSLSPEFSSIQLSGGAGDDVLIGTPNGVNNLNGDDSTAAGTDTLVGGELNDNLNGVAGPDSLTGAGGNDSLNGGLGDDAISGGPGSDSYTSSAADGADAFSGGTGIDTFNASSRPNGVGISLDDVANDGEGCPDASCEGDNISSDVEAVFTGLGDDTVVGGALANSISANSGNDAIFAGAGDDAIAAASGNDTVAGEDGIDSINLGVGSDTADGGGGDDIINGNLEDEPDTYAGGAGTDSFATNEFNRLASVVSLDDVANDVLVNPPYPVGTDNVRADIENVSGGDGDDTLIGNDSANVLSGGAGNDALAAGAGADSLFGSDGNDTLDGGIANDTLTGDAGTDSLRSRDKSADQVDCGSSVDTVLGDGADEPEASCEQVSRGVEVEGAKLAGKTVELKVSCPAVEGIACKAKAKLKAAGKTIGSGKAKIGSGKAGTIEVGLNADGVKAASGPGKLKADATVTFTDAAGEKVTTKQKVSVG
jgi:Ca2+-binding RTX toxin-like protein